MADKTEHLKLAMWARTESAKLATDWPPGSVLERRLLTYWKTNRPKMMADVGTAATPLAHVLVNRMLEANRQYVTAGMAPTDAREQAEREWLIQEPESDEIETSPIRQLLGRTTM